jgi:hypothetical protein
MVNHFYFYCVDEDFGPFFLKFCSYSPYTAKLCINGHEYAKRQLVKDGIAHESLDNGILSCADPQRQSRLLTSSVPRVRGGHVLLRRAPGCRRLAVARVPDVPTNAAVPCRTGQCTRR